MTPQVKVQQAIIEVVKAEYEDRLRSTNAALPTSPRPNSAANKFSGRRRCWIGRRGEVNLGIAKVERNVAQAEVEAADTSWNGGP